MPFRRVASSRHVDILSSILPIIAKCAPVLDSDPVKLMDKDVQFSYTRLQARCFLVAEELIRVKNLLDPDRQDIQNLLDHLENLVISNESVLSVSPPVLQSHQKLLAVLDLYSQLQHLTSRDKHRTLSRWFDYTSQHQNERIGRALQSFYDDCQDRYAEGTYNSLEEQPLLGKRREPPFGVSEAAETVFGSLLDVKACVCHPSWHYEARLCLATHRRPEELVSRSEFDLHITPDQTWQQIGITMNDQTSITLNLNDSSSKVAARNSNIAAKEVKTLCKPITAIRNWRWHSHRLVFSVERGKLWSSKPEMRKVSVDPTGDKVSLEDFIARQQTPFTDMTKRIVAVLLAYTMLHLHGTRWIQQQWGPSHVVFLPFASTIPIRPYVQVSLAEDCMARSTPHSDESVDDFFDYGDVEHHPFPDFVMLAIMLMQVYLARTFRSFAEEFGVNSPDTLSANDKYLLALDIFGRYSKVLSFSQRYWAAISNCLDPHIGVSEEDTDLDADMLRRITYEKIIAPLEDELAQGRFSSDDDLILNLDVRASNLDLANWGQEILLQTQEYSQQTSLPKRMPASQQWKTVTLQHSGSATPDKTDGGRFTRAAQRRQSSTLTLPASWRNAQRSDFFDDQSLPRDKLQEAKRKDYYIWKRDILHVYDTFLFEDDKRKPMRIAVLDTGLDLKHPDFVFDTERLQRIGDSRNFIHPVSDSRHMDVRDINGHGTHTASLLLDFSPQAHVYIAKIADHDPHDCNVVAEAIKHAVVKWQVDVISMSFGYTTRDSKGYSVIEEAIDHAQSKGVLLFAAASNNGANQQRTFPARHDSVICIHSTASDGVPSRFNPPPDKIDNFATVGEVVESAWPIALCDQDKNAACLAWKSGTSFATPIAAGIASFLLQYVAENLGEEYVRLLKKPRGLRAVFMEISFRSKEYDYVTLKIHPDHLFGKDKAYVKQRLSVILKDS